MGNCKDNIDILALGGCYDGDNVSILQFLNNNVLAVVNNGNVLGDLDLSDYREVVDEFSLNPIKLAAGEERTLPFNPYSNGARTQTTAFNIDDALFSYAVAPTRTQNDVGADFDIDSLITDITCNKLNEYNIGDATGSIVATATEPSATYIWTNSGGDEIGTTDTLTGLTVGTYTAVVSSDTFADMNISVDVNEAAINNEIEIEFKTSTDLSPDFTSIAVSHTFNTNYYINDACSFADFITALNQYFDATPYDDGGNTVTPTLTNLFVSEVDETLQTFTIVDSTSGESVWYHITTTLKGGNTEYTSGDITPNVSSFDFSTFDWTSVGTNSVVIEMFVLGAENPIIFDTSFFDVDIETFDEFIITLQSFIAGDSYTDAYGLTQTSNIGDYITIENIVSVDGTFELRSVLSDVIYTFIVTPNINVVEVPFTVVGVTSADRMEITIPTFRYLNGSIKTVFILAEFCSECTSAKYEWAYLDNPCTDTYNANCDIQSEDLLWQTAGGMLSLSGADDVLITDTNKIPPIKVRNIQNCDIWLNVMLIQ